MLTKSISAEYRRSESSDQFPSVIRPGCPVNTLLRKIVDDIVNDMVHGMNAFHYHRNELKIFLDSVIFIADYQAIAYMFNFMKHTAKSFRSRFCHVKSSNCRDLECMHCTQFCIL